MSNFRLEYHEELKSVSLAYPLTPTEYEDLVYNCRNDGRILDPIIYWDHTDPDGVLHHFLVDGHHRNQIALEYKLPFDIRPLPNGENMDLDDVQAWMLSHMTGQRNPDSHVIRLIRGRLASKKLAKAEEVHEGLEDKTVEDLPPVTVEDVGTNLGISRRTVKRDMAYAHAWDQLSQEIQGHIIAHGMDKGENTILPLSLFEPRIQKKLVKWVLGGKGKLGAFVREEVERREKEQESDSTPEGDGYEPTRSASRYEPTEECPHCGCFWWYPEDDTYRCDACGQFRDEPVGDTEDDLDERLPGDVVQAKEAAPHEALIKKMRAAIGVLIRGFLELDNKKFREPLKDVAKFLGKEMDDALELDRN